MNRDLIYCSLIFLCIIFSKPCNSHVPRHLKLTTPKATSEETQAKDASDKYPEVIKTKVKPPRMDDPWFAAYNYDVFNPPIAHWNNDAVVKVIYGVNQNTRKPKQIIRRAVSSTEGQNPMECNEFNCTAMVSDKELDFLTKQRRADSMPLLNHRVRRPFDVPQIECPPSKDGTERISCPSPDHTNRYKCIEDLSICDGFIDCPNAEDEDMGACMFFKATKTHFDVLADAVLRWARERSDTHKHKRVELKDKTSAVMSKRL